MNHMKYRLVISASLLVFAAGCAAPASSPIPTAIPPEILPTVIAQTAESANKFATTAAVASTPTELSTLPPRATQTFSPAVTFTPTSIPGHDFAAIQIISPGPMSKVVSPIALKMNIVTGLSKVVVVDLYGEDGRLISRLLKQNVPTSTDGIEQNIKIPFEIIPAGELGRLSVSTQDEFGRVQSMNSVRVVLLSSGVNEIATEGSPYEPIYIFKPGRKDAASGGVLSVRGDFWPFNLNPVIVELLSPEGKSLSLRVMKIEHLDPQMLETTLPYKVSGPVNARLAIQQEDDRIGGLFYIYTQEILLNP